MALPAFGPGIDAGCRMTKMPFLSVPFTGLPLPSFSSPFNRTESVERTNDDTPSPPHDDNLVGR